MGRKSVSVNLSDRCRVRLTQQGLQALYRYFLTLYRGHEGRAKESFDARVQNGILETEFHSLMTYFSEFFVNGADYRYLPFVDNEIVFI